MFNKKKIVSVLLVLMLMLSASGCGDKDSSTSGSSGPGENGGVNPDNPDIILVTDTSGLGSGGMNDMCWAGCERASEDFGLGIYCIETPKGVGYDTVLEEACGMTPQLIICAGSDMAETLKTIAENHTDMNFAIVNASGIGDNAAGISFKIEEGAFLAGIAAGLTTESKIVSFLGAEENEEQDRYQYGFASGLAAVSMEIYDNSQYIGSYTDEEAAKTIAGGHIALGSDVIFHASGRCGGIIIDTCAAKEVWVIGSGSDQSELNSDWVLCSVVRRAENCIYDVISEIADGSFDGSDREYSVADGGVEISDNAGNLSEDLLEEMEKYEEMMASGELTVPTDYQSYYDYTQALGMQQEGE